MVKLLQHALASLDFTDRMEDLAQDALSITIALAGQCNFAAQLERQAKNSPLLCFIVLRGAGKQQKSDNLQFSRGLRIPYQ